MSGITNQLGISGNVSISLEDYHKLVSTATQREKTKESFKKRRRAIEQSAREIEQFLTFLYKNSSINMEEYVRAFNSKSSGATLVVDDKDKRILVDLGGITNDKEKQKQDES